MLINFLEAPVLAFILAFLVRYINTDTSNDIGYIFRENSNLPAYIFMSVIVALFVGLTVSAEEIIRDQKIRKREKFLNLSKGSYLISKITIMFVISAIQTLSFIIIGNTILEIQGMNIAYWIVLFSTACFANMLGLNISASFNSAVTIYILIPFLVIPQLLLSGVIVKFSKLNPIITLQNSVPFVGDVMASRWAYEALAVHQFKSNDFERQFYPLDKNLKIAEFKKNFWLAKLREKISSTENNINNPDKKQQVNENLLLLRNEITKELKNNPNVSFTEIENLYIQKLTPDVFNATKKYLAQLNTYYLRKYKKANSRRDALATKLNATKEKKELFLQMKNKYTNDALSDFVKDKNEFNKILELDGQLFQKSDPIYLTPTSGRAHFYAPSKKMIKIHVDTYWYNVIIIWSMSILLIIALYYDLLRKSIEGLSKIVERIKK